MVHSVWIGCSTCARSVCGWTTRRVWGFGILFSPAVKGVCEGDFAVVESGQPSQGHGVVLTRKQGEEC